MRKNLYLPPTIHTNWKSDCHFGRESELLSMSDIKCDTDIPLQTHLKEMLCRARYIFDNYHLDCFADDTGLKEALVGHRVYIRPLCRRCTQFGSKQESC